MAVRAVASGRISAPGFFNNPLIREAWCGARWDGPAQTHLDPVKEAKASAAEVARGWKTNEQVTREYYGENWEENMLALAEEKELMDKVGISFGGRDIEDDDEEDEKEEEEK